MIQNPTDKGYKVYTALLSQSGTVAPTAVVLDNTIGAITFGYEDTGVYQVNLVGAFLEFKVFTISSPSPNPSGNVGIERINNDQLRIAIAGSLDDLLLNTPIEIRVYP